MQWRLNFWEKVVVENLILTLHLLCTTVTSHQNTFFDDVVPSYIGQSCLLFLNRQKLLCTSLMKSSQNRFLLWARLNFTHGRKPNSPVNQSALSNEPDPNAIKQSASIRPSQTGLCWTTVKEMIVSSTVPILYMSRVRHRPHRGLQIMSGHVLFVQCLPGASVIITVRLQGNNLCFDHIDHK